MNSWRPYPLLRLVIPFVAGISAEGFIGSVAGAQLWIAALLVILLLVAQFLPALAGRYRLRWITGLVFNWFLFIAGYEIANSHRPANDPGYFGKNPDGDFIAAIAEPPSITSSGIKAILKIRYHLVNGSWRRSCGSAIGYLKNRPGATVLQYGDLILLHAGFTAIRDNSNPHTFDYPRYLRNKGISHRVYAEAACWRNISLEPSGSLRKFAFRVRDRLLDILRENRVEGKEFAVAAALLLGYTDDLDAGLRNDYAATGAMHILSVSGMHVGIIYVFLEFLLGFLNKSRPGRVLKAILLLVFIWFYAMVTGLSPCVMRSAAMLSLPILGKSLNRSPDMYNIIAASMIFILAMDPFLVSDVGFQLSYLAVTGIIILYKPVYDLYITSAWIPDKIWSVLAVSIAAQVATLPITLYTFHQFPNYFMLTNIFVVPLSSLIIYAGILVLAVGNIPVVCLLFARLLVFLIWSLNTVIHFIEQLPCSTIRGIFISVPEMLLLYVIIAAMFIFLTSRRIAFLYVCIVAAIVLNLFVMDFKIHRLGRSLATVFNASHETLIMFSTQDKAIVLYNGTNRYGGILQKLNHNMVQADMDAHGIYSRREFWLKGRGRPPEIAGAFVPVIVFGNYIQFEGCRVAVLSKSIPKNVNRSLDVDLLVLSGSPKLRISDAFQVFHPEQIIIGSDNSGGKTRQWMKEAAVLGVKCHAVTELGAFQKEF
ncbi:MAG: ComEC/Rec2 family competence protein [Bacteroidetes bacterium]|nr:ComEC/Rec2 family competence protein [Bacteroidota bacterium]